MGTAALRCVLPAWLFAWVAAVFVPSVLIAYAGLSPFVAATGTGVSRLPAASWQVADDVGPVVKLTIGALLLLGLVATRRLTRTRPGWRYPAAIGVGLAATTITAAFVPSGLSRGFGIGLTGARFDAAVTPLYLLGGLLAGIVFVLSADRCERAKGR